MINLNDTFKADGNEWKVVDIDDVEGVTVAWDKYLINVCTCDKAVFVYRLFKNGSTHHVDWAFSFAEIKMVAEIIERVEDRGVKQNISR